MELKHKECFIPATINYWDLQGVSKYAREAAEFVNLYSTSRGINRFPARSRPWSGPAAGRKSRRGPSRVADPAIAPRLDPARDQAGQPGLEGRGRAEPRSGPDAHVEVVRAINDAVEKMVHGVPPFPCVRESLQKLCPRADILVVSATPHSALLREWENTA